MPKDIAIETAENQLGNAGSQLWRHLVPAPLKLRPYGAIEICLLLLLLLLLILMARHSILHSEFAVGKSPRRKVD